MPHNPAWPLRHCTLSWSPPRAPHAHSLDGVPDLWLRLLLEPDALGVAAALQGVPVCGGGTTQDQGEAGVPVLRGRDQGDAGPHAGEACTTALANIKCSTQGRVPGLPGPAHTRTAACPAAAAAAAAEAAGAYEQRQRQRTSMLKTPSSPHTCSSSPISGRLGSAAAEKTGMQTEASGRPHSRGRGGASVPPTACGPRQGCRRRRRLVSTQWWLDSSSGSCSASGQQAGRGRREPCQACRRVLLGGYGTQCGHPLHLLPQENPRPSNFACRCFPSSLRPAPERGLC